MGFSEGKSVSRTTLVTVSSPEVSLFQRITWLLNTIYNQILAILSVLLIWFFIENHITTTFFVHLLFSTVAYVPLMAAAIILFSEDNLVTLYIPRKRRYWIHGILLTISCVSVTIGIAVETHDKFKSNKIHFHTNHAILGLVSWILVFAAVVIGLVAGNTQKFSRFIKPVIAKFAHNFLGIAGFAIGMGSLYLKLDIIQLGCSENVYIASQWALWYLTIWSLLAAFKSLWGQLKSIIS